MVTVDLQVNYELKRQINQGFLREMTLIRKMKIKWIELISAFLKTTKEEMKKLILPI